MNVKEWAEKNRKTPSYLKSEINRIQDDKVERVVIKKTFKVSETIEFIDKRVYNKACLDLLLNGESFELKKADGTKERIDPSRVTKTIAVDVQKDSLVVSEFENNESVNKNFTAFMDAVTLKLAQENGIPLEILKQEIKKEKANNDKPLFRQQYLGKPWKPKEEK